MANLPGGRSAPEIIAASVSRIMNLVFSTTASGSARSAAPLMNVLSVVITSLTSAASAASKPNSGRKAAAANTPPADCNSRRRLTMERSCIVVLFRLIGGRLRTQIVFDHLAALHDELHVLYLGDVLKWITIGCDQVCVLPFFDRAEVLVLVEDRRVDAGRHLQHVRGRGTPL